MTGGNGPDAVIEAVGMEIHGAGGMMESIQTKLTSTERPFALSQAILAESLVPLGSAEVGKLDVKTWFARRLQATA